MASAYLCNTIHGLQLDCIKEAKSQRVGVTGASKQVISQTKIFKQKTKRVKSFGDKTKRYQTQR